MMGRTWFEMTRRHGEWIRDYKPDSVSLFLAIMEMTPRAVAHVIRNGWAWAWVFGDQEHVS